MEIARKRGEENTLVQEYVLPDFSTRRRGLIREHLSKSSATSDEQSLRLSNERFAVPEILFHPSDIGIEQMGIPEAITHAISLTPREMHPHLYANIVLTGGNTVFPGFCERVGIEIRKLAPTEYDVNVFMPDNPITYAWHGGRIIPDRDKRPGHMVPVTLAEYKEHGHSICHRRFGELQTWTWSSD